jgi:hypothetical protein
VFPINNIINPRGPIFFLLITIRVHSFKVFDASNNVVKRRMKTEIGKRRGAIVLLFRNIPERKGNKRIKTIIPVRSKLFLVQFANAINLRSGFSIHLKPNASSVKKKLPMISNMIPITDSEY